MSAATAITLAFLSIGLVGAAFAAAVDSPWLAYLLLAAALVCGGVALADGIVDAMRDA